jgi:hypothetical protein
MGVVADRGPQRHASSQRITHDVGLVDFEMLHQRRNIVGHRCEPKGRSMSAVRPWAGPGSPGGGPTEPE